MNQNNPQDKNGHIKVPVKIPKTTTKSKIERVAFFGSADIDEQHPLYQEAFNVARTLAYQNKVIVNGGGPGVMNASTQGAKAGGGETIAVTFYPKDMPEFEGRYFKNQVDKEIKTANYIERMFGLMDEADAFICFRGGTGTLSEWATAWLLSHLYYGHHKPLILYGEFWQEVIDVIFDHFFIGDKEMKIFKIVKDEEELLKVLKEFEEEMHNRDLESRDKDIESRKEQS
jgi:uncharacterized protein (TIGR00730 family)